MLERPKSLSERVLERDLGGNSKQLEEREDKQITEYIMIFLEHAKKEEEKGNKKIQICSSNLPVSSLSGDEIRCMYAALIDMGYDCFKKSHYETRGLDIGWGAYSTTKEFSHYTYYLNL